MTTATDARGRILEAACDLLAADGVDDVRIARIATAAGVSPALVHYHFATREALLAEALEHSFQLLGDLRTTAADDEAWTCAQRLGWMVDQSLPFPGEGERDVRLWLELWGHAARKPELRDFARRLYARYDDWIADVVLEGIDGGEFGAGEPAQVTRRVVAMLDGVGPRVLVGDLDLAAARRLVVGGLARELGVPEAAFDSRGHA